MILLWFSQKGLAHIGLFYVTLCLVCGTNRHVSLPRSYSVRRALASLQMQAEPVCSPLTSERCGKVCFSALIPASPVPLRQHLLSFPDLLMPAQMEGQRVWISPARNSPSKRLFNGAFRRNCRFSSLADPRRGAVGDGAGIVIQRCCV